MAMTLHNNVRQPYCNVSRCNLPVITDSRMLNDDGGVLSMAGAFVPPAPPDRAVSVPAAVTPTEPNRTPPFSYD